MRSFATTARRRRHGELDPVTMAQLYDEARRLGVPGRSKMDRPQLVEAVQQARGSPRASFPNRRHSLLAAAHGRLSPLAFFGRLVTDLRGPGQTRTHIWSAVAYLRHTRRIILLAVIVSICGGLGLLVALSVVPNEQSSALMRRVRNGVTETGRVETVTTPAGVKRVIRWRTRAGRSVIETVSGPLRVTTLNGQTFYLAGPSHTVRVPVTTVKTLPVTETVTDTATETVHDSVTETVHDTVTETVYDTTTEVVTEIVTVTAPGP